MVNMDKKCFLGKGNFLLQRAQQKSAQGVLINFTAVFRLFSAIIRMCRYKCHVSQAKLSGKASPHTAMEPSARENRTLTKFNS
jgi:hypothetical protein